MTQKRTKSKDKIEKDSLVLTARETSKLLRISKTTVYDLIRQGDIPSIRFGKKILVPRAALMRKLDEVDRKAS